MAAAPELGIRLDAWAGLAAGASPPFANASPSRTRENVAIKPRMHFCLSCFGAALPAGGCMPSGCPFDAVPDAAYAQSQPLSPSLH